MSTALEKPDRALPAKALSVSAFEQAIGGRSVLFEVLSQADTTPEIHQLLGWLGDPEYADDSLAHICRLANLQPGEVFSAFERALQHRAKILARIPVAEELPLVAADAMRRARTHKTLCTECNGRTYYFEKTKQDEMVKVPCLHCVEGWVNQEPSLEQQKMALELGELLQKSGLQINQNVDNSKTVQVSMGSTLARLQAAAAEEAFSIEATEPKAVPGTVEGSLV